MADREIITGVQLKVKKADKMKVYAQLAEYFNNLHQYDKPIDAFKDSSLMITEDSKRFVLNGLYVEPELDEIAFPQKSRHSNYYIDFLEVKVSNHQYSSDGIFMNVVPGVFYAETIAETKGMDDHIYTNTQMMFIDGIKVANDLGLDYKIVEKGILHDNNEFEITKSAVRQDEVDKGDIFTVQRYVGKEFAMPKEKIKETSVKLKQQPKLELEQIDLPFDLSDSQKTNPNVYMSLEEAGKNWKAWADLKSKTLTTKDAGVLMGHTPWRSREELLAEKKKFISFTPEKNSEEENRMQRGMVLQEKAKELFVETTAIQLTEGAVYRSEDHPVMMARLPQVSKDGNFPVQILSTSSDYAYLWDGGSVPPNVRDEAQWNMAVTGTNTAFVGCYIDNQLDEKTSRFVSRVIERNDYEISLLIKKAEDFRKEMESEFLHVPVAKEALEKKEQSYELTLPEGTEYAGVKVTIPTRFVTNSKGKNVLSLPIKNKSGASFVFRKDNGKSISSAEIYCAVNKVHGKVLFVNNRTSLKKLWEKKNQLKEMLFSDPSLSK